jgi:hypothetical protein
VLRVLRVLLVLELRVLKALKVIRDIKVLEEYWEIGDLFGPHKHKPIQSATKLEL